MAHMAPHDPERRALEITPCPACGRPLPPSGGYGTGRLADGLYCSLDCLAAVVYGSANHDPSARGRWN